MPRMIFSIWSLFQNFKFQLHVHTHRCVDEVALYVLFLYSKYVNAKYTILQVPKLLVAKLNVKS